MGTVAVVKTSGRQYFLTEGQEFEVNRIEGQVGDSISLSDVLLVSKDSNVQVGTPVVNGAKVEASIIRQLRGPKLIIFKKIRRRGKELKKGHRQDLTRLKVTSISA
jgi:large subunit ribosomal protein L21